MSSSSPRPHLFAVDIGNSQVKVGYYRGIRGEDLSEPSSVLEISGASAIAESLGPWVERAVGSVDERVGRESLWCLASVNRSGSRSLTQWIRSEVCCAKIVEIGVQDVPIEVRVPAPEKVGIDRIVAAWSANRRRSAESPAITIDVGTAITVDLISTDGAFLGGAILPGPGLSARALAENTDLLPYVPIVRLGEPPSALGTSTESAIRAGVFWGAVGAMREMIARLSAETAVRPQVFLTGGAARAVAGLLGQAVQYEPHLVLSGIAGICAAGRLEMDAATDEP
jgi:type III pantothenate kinase